MKRKFSTSYRCCSSFPGKRESRAARPRRLPPWTPAFAGATIIVVKADSIFSDALKSRKYRSEGKWGGSGDRQHGSASAVHALVACRDGNGCPCCAQGVALRGSRFSPALARRRRRLCSALAGDAGGRPLRLSAHPLPIHRPPPDDAPNAADGALWRRRPPHRPPPRTPPPPSPPPPFPSPALS